MNLFLTISFNPLSLCRRISTWLLSNGSLIDDLEAEWLSGHFPYGISHYEKLLYCNQLAVIGGPLGFGDGVKLYFVKFVISCEGCLLGHVVLPNLILLQPVLSSLWWLLHRFLNGVIQSGNTWNWDIVGAALFQLLGYLVPVGPSARWGIHHFWFCNPHTCLWTVK